jgi:hypothetical protein
MGIIIRKKLLRFSEPEFSYLLNDAVAFLLRLLQGLKSPVIPP